jgi:hypothetical protein
MALDLKKSYSDASEDISAIKTVKDTSKQDKKLKKNKVKDTNTDKKNSKKQITSDGESKSVIDKYKDIKSSNESPIEKLLNIFTQTDDGQSADESEDQNGKKKQRPKAKKSLERLSTIFLTAGVRTKEKIINILINEIIYTIGCAQNQSYSNVSITNTPIYIKIKNIDFFNILKYSPSDEFTKYSYEELVTQNGVIPYSMNRQLFTRLTNPASFSQQYGNSYKGASGNEIFDIQYELVQNEQYFKIILKSQPNNQDTISAFLNDYYKSVDIFNIDNLLNNVLSKLFNAADFTNKTPQEELTVTEKFFSIIKRLMGVCSDPSQKIEVSGNAKVSDNDLINEDFFSVSDNELKSIEEKVNNIQNGIVTFDGCDSIPLPVNVVGVDKLMGQVINENKSEKKVQLFLSGLNGLSKDPNWNNSVDPLGLNILDFIFKELIVDLPSVLLKTILSPKFMLGFMVMFKAIKTVGLNTLTEYYDGLLDFLKKFKKIIFRISKEIVSIFIEELFNEIKKNIKLLVEDILLDIIGEQGKKYYDMYANIVYALLQVSQAFVDFKNCKSVIDEILKLLNLGVKSLNIGLPQFVLAGASQLGGISNTRAFAATIKNLQKAGLPTGDNADGSPNLMNIALKAMIEGTNSEMAKNGKTEVFIPPLTITPAGITLPSKGVGKSY